MKKKLIKSRPESVRKNYEEICKILDVVRTSTAQLGDRFRKIYENKNYQIILGDNKGTFKEFLADPRIDKSFPQVIKLIKNNEKYIQEMGLRLHELYELDNERLYRARLLVTPETIWDWLERMRTLSRADFNHFCKHGNLPQDET